ncbi:LPXTG cell wall anchor domain-containing protein [Actinoplanes sp. NBRC 101535]|uniref:LPXTG cell wall anchor domain-containing protein n=1 Tax=Actinoplanes sp. NBRC 101535 TaxID=3032196 RepID=UPI002554BDB2|nr:LPXTG cell wall anchor domain-containing protein [Actinoplanes sp. NBRC 101535]
MTSRFRHERSFALLAAAAVVLIAAPAAAAPPETVDMRTAVSGPAEVVAGEILGIEIGTTVPGPPPPTGVKLTVTLPEGVGYEGEGGGSGPCSGEAGGRVVVCIPDPEVPDPGNRSWGLGGRVAASVPAGTTLTTTVVVSSDSEETNPADNTAQLVTTVVDRAAESLTVTGPADPIVPGQPFRATVKARHGAGQPLKNFHLITSFGDWFEGGRIVNLPEVECSADPGSLLCETGKTLEPNSELSFEYEFRTSADPKDYPESAVTLGFRSYSYSQDYTVSASTLIHFAKAPAPSTSVSVSPSASRSASASPSPSRSVSASPSVSPSATGTGGGLPITGSATAPLMAVGALLVAAGTGALLATRRRRTF